MKLNRYKIEFDDLFDSKQQAVVCYLSLEHLYLDLCKQHRELPCKGVPPYVGELINPYCPQGRE